MWARVMECMLACWLAVSPLIFQYPTGKTLWAETLIGAGLTALFALLSFWSPLSKIHLLILGVAGWLLSLGYETFPAEALPIQENFSIIGLSLLMLAIIPSHSHFPPRSWRTFLSKKRHK